MDEISAVVCIKNKATTIDNCLRSLLNNQPDEIIVIYDDSTDNSLEIAQKYTDKVYHNDGIGLAHARQQGAERARNKYIFYIDADAEPSGKDTLLKLLEELKSKEWIAIQGLIIDPYRDQTYWERGESLFWDYRINTVGEKSILPTTNCLIERDIVLKYKFDPFFKGAFEDTDFFYRLHKAGYKFGTSSEIVYHHHRADFHSFFRQKIWFGRGNARFFWKHKVIKVFFVPLFLLIEPTWFCIKYKKPELIFYFILWSIALSYGFISELFGLILE